MKKIAPLSRPDEVQSMTLVMERRKWGLLLAAIRERIAHFQRRRSPTFKPKPGQVDFNDARIAELDRMYAVIETNLNKGDQP